MDPLDDIFQAMRVHHALYARLETSAPWGVRFAPGESARFGLVIRGSCWLSVEGRSDAIPLAAGDCYVLVRGSRYILSDHPSSPSRDCVDVVRNNIGGVVNLEGGGAPATIITGWFLFDKLSARPLLNFMPLVLHVRMDQAGASALQSTLQILANETDSKGLGSNVVVSRLADVIFVQAIRAYIASSDLPEIGWLGAVSDARIGPVLRAMHEDITAQWTVENLASIASLSRSAFAARFRDRVGQTPLDYLTRWRMYRAGYLLRQSDQSISEIAELVGYDSAASFGKAFKRSTDRTPHEFRLAERKPQQHPVAPANPDRKRNEVSISKSSNQIAFDAMQQRDTAGSSKVAAD